MPDDVVIDKITEETTLLPDGTAPQKVRVTFRVGKDGPFSKVYDRATFNPREARSEIDNFARELQALRRT